MERIGAIYRLPQFTGYVYPTVLALNWLGAHLEEQGYTLEGYKFPYKLFSGRSGPLIILDKNANVVGKVSRCRVITENPNLQEILDAFEQD